MRISLEPATVDDADRLFRWRNDPVTRKNSRNTNPVKWAEHIAWFQQTLMSPERKVFVAYNESRSPVGSVHIHNFGGCIEIGWTVAPEHRSQGYGRAMVEAALRFSPDQDIFAIIKTANRASLRIANSCGFELVDWPFKSTADSLSVWKIDKRQGNGVAPAISSSASLYSSDPPR